MANFIVATDSGCDLPAEACAERDIHVLRLEYRFGDEIILDTMEWADCHAFYERMRAGEIPKTSQISIGQFVDFWKTLVPEGKPIVHISLGSGVSGTYANGLLAAKLFRDEYPNIPIYMVDSTLCSIGYGILALHAADLRDEGKTADECVAWLESHKAGMNTWYTTDELKYLYQSGRVSKAGLIVATALNINPILDLDLEGHLIVQEKCRGRKATVKRIHQIVEALCPPQYRDQTLYICHSDIPEDAHTFGDGLKEAFGFPDVYYTYIGPTIGSHCGPGLMAAFFFGRKRTMEKGGIPKEEAEAATV